MAGRGGQRKTGTSELLFPLKGKKDLGEERRVDEPVHDSFTLLDERKSESREKEKLRK